MKKVELVIDKNRNKNNGVFAVSIVDNPAIESNFIKLSKIEKVEDFKTFKLSTDEQQIITGPVLIPNKLIYRNAETLGGEDGYVYFSAETIKELCELFLADCHNNDLTLQHEFDIAAGDMTLYESWIILDSKYDKSKALGYDLSAGTWMMSLKVNNNQLWKDIKEGKYNGFSIEAIMIAKTIAKLKKEDFNESIELTENTDVDKMKLIEFLKNIIDIIEIPEK